MSFTAIEHPETFKEGVRLVMRVWRNKEQQEGRRPGRTLISHCAQSWAAAVDALSAECVTGERVYASGEARNIEKAIRVFKERQLAADYDAPEVRHDFYNSCFNRWLSCLGAPQASAETYFLFDCDTPEDYETLKMEMAAAPPEYVGGKIVHTYRTKNGVHVFTKPFNPGLLSIPMRRLRQTNPLMLVGWT